MNKHIELPAPYQREVYATPENTPAVRKGFEMGGYVKSPDLWTREQIEAAHEQARVVGEPVAQWQKRHPLRTNDRWENTDEHDAKWWRDHSQGWEIRALFASPPAPLEAQAGMVLVPMRLTQAIRDVIEGEGWAWEDLLAAAEAITEDEYAALRASSPAEPTINLKGHEFKPSDLLRRGVLNLRKGRSEFFWAVVSKSFGLGSTCSAALAAWAGRDPDTGIVTKERT